MSNTAKHVVSTPTNVPKWVIMGSATSEGGVLLHRVAALFGVSPGTISKLRTKVCETGKIKGRQHSKKTSSSPLLHWVTIEIYREDLQPPVALLHRPCPEGTSIFPPVLLLGASTNSTSYRTHAQVLGTHLWRAHSCDWHTPASTWSPKREWMPTQ